MDRVIYTSASFFFFTFYWCSAIAKLNLPNNLSERDRKTAIEILGYGTASRILSDPYPLGGYSGLEFGVTNEVINTQNISTLGNRSVAQTETSYTSLTLGKGLFNHFDFYFSFSPASSTENFSAYSAQIRWGFYESPHRPLYSSVVVHGSTAQFDQLLSMSTQGIDVVGGYRIEELILFYGVGYLKVQGYFEGGNLGLTDTNNPSSEVLTGQRFFAGIHIQLNPWFMAMQIERVAQTSYAAKIGVRF
jgi:hypothetical protein